MVSNIETELVETGSVGNPHKSGALLWILIIFIAFILAILTGLFIYLNSSFHPVHVPHNKTASITHIVTPTMSQETFDVDEKVSSSASKYCLQGYGDSCKTDIYLKDKNSGKETFFLTIDNVRVDSVPDPEYVNGNLFIVRRLGDTNTENWTDAVWEYDQQGKGREIAQAKGITFSVNGNGTLIGIYPNEVSSTSKNPSVILINTQNSQSTAYDISNKNCDGEISFDKWESTNVILWGAYSQTIRTLCFWNINSQTHKVTIYPFTPPVANIVPQLMGFNPDKKIVLYIDKQFSFAADIEADYEKSGKTYSLFVYNLETNIATKVYTFPSTWQETKILANWDSLTEFHFNTPNGSSTYTLP